LEADNVIGGMDEYTPDIRQTTIESAIQIEFSKAVVNLARTHESIVPKYFPANANLCDDVVEIITAFVSITRTVDE
jgi:hypothetical protein